MQVLSSVPAPVLLLFAVLVAVAYACGIQLVVRRRLAAADYAPPTSPVFSVVNTLYAVVLGFLCIVVWQHYNDTKERVWLEVAAVADTWHDAVGLPPPVRHVVRADMLAYTHAMIDHEWGLMRNGGFDPVGDALIMSSTTRVGTLVPANAGQATAQSATLHELTDLHDARQRRLAQNDSAISGFEWLILVLGAVLVVSMCWLYDVEDRFGHLAMTGGVAILLTMLLVLIFEMQYPFRGDLAIKPTAWTAFLQHVEVMDRGTMPAMRM